MTIPPSPNPLPTTEGLRAVYDAAKGVNIAYTPPAKGVAITDAPTTEGVTQGRLTTIQSPLPDWAENERTAILEQLAMIEKHYRAQAQPYMDQLSKLEGCRPPPKMFIHSAHITEAKTTREEWEAAQDALAWLEINATESKVVGDAYAHAATVRKVLNRLPPPPGQNT